SLLGMLARLEKQAQALVAAVDTLPASQSALKTQAANEVAALTTAAEKVVADVGALLGDATATALQDQLKADLDSAPDGLKQRLTAIGGLIDSLPKEVPGEARQALKGTVGLVLGDIADPAGYVTALLGALRVRDELSMKFEWKP